MNAKKILISSIAAFAFVFIFEMLWHGFLMKDLYEATASVWRPQEDCNMGVMLLSQFLFALSMTIFWAKIGKHGECKKGIGFGVLSGLVVASPQLATFCYLPIPITISLLWMLSVVLRGLGVGLIIAKLYKA